MSTHNNKRRSPEEIVRVLFHNYCVSPPATLLDRFLSRALQGLSDREKARYARTIFLLVRFGYTALFVLKQKPGRQKEKSDSSMRSSVRHSLTRFATELSDPAQMRRALFQAPFSALLAAVLSRVNKSGIDTGRNEMKKHHPHDRRSPSAVRNPQSKGYQAVIRILRQDDSLPLRCLYHGIPLWLTGLIERRIQTSKWTSRQIDAFFNNCDSRPPLWVRVNFPHHIDAVRDELAAAGFSVRQSKNALALDGTLSIYKTRQFTQGVIEVQDLSSQRAGNAVSPAQDELVWDACAGNGGKTMLFSSLLKNKGAVYGSDVKSGKLILLKKRARRAGFHNVRTFIWDGRSTPPLPGEAKRRSGFDWVFVDAPCSVSGTWRRNPDAKLRFHPRDLAGLNALQRDILSHASCACRKSGRLVYATCSLFVEENEDIVQWFLGTANQFVLLSQTLEGNPDADSDTAFVAVFQKK